MKAPTYLLLATLLALLSDGVSAGIIVMAIFPVASLVGIGADLLIAGGVIGVTGGVVGANKSKEAAASKASSKSASLASVARVSSVSMISASKASVNSARQSKEGAARASVAAQTAAQAAALKSHDTKLDVFTFQDPATKVKARSPEPTSTHLGQLMQRMALSKRTIVTNATGWPIAPAGVPQFNFDDCVLDLRAHLTNGGTMKVFQPEGVPTTVQVDSVPPRCMVLASVILPKTELGARPIAFAAQAFNG